MCVCPVWRGREKITLHLVSIARNRDIEMTGDVAREGGGGGIGTEIARPDGLEQKKH